MQIKKDEGLGLAKFKLIWENRVENLYNEQTIMKVKSCKTSYWRFGVRKSIFRSRIIFTLFYPKDIAFGNTNSANSTRA